MTRRIVSLLLGMVAIALAGCRNDSANDLVSLSGRAVLPADTFTPGPAVGSQLTRPHNDRRPPFLSPPVQGFSSLIHIADNRWLVLQDNGFGNLANSPDYPLHLFELDLDLEVGTVAVTSAIRLADPDELLGFATVRPSGDSGLYGADLDPESMARLDDGTLWIGEEFGPYLIHVDAAGRVIEAPVEVPVPVPLRAYARGRDTFCSPDHPDLRHHDETARLATANLPRSGGLEGMARLPGSTRLVVALEKALLDDPVRGRRVLLEFDAAAHAFTGRHWWYRPDQPDLAIAALEAWTDSLLLITERDHAEGGEARLKRIYRLDLNRIDEEGFLVKQLVCDLLDIDDAGGLTSEEAGAVGLGRRFSFPFVTPECLVILDARTLLVANDNNYPFSSGRRPGACDDNEFVRLRLPESLPLRPR